MRGPALVLLAAAALLRAARRRRADDARLPLAAGWAMQSSKQVAAAGPELSRPGFSTAGWYAVRVPNTVLGAMVDAGSLPDPYFGMNLRLIPGTTYKIGERFTLLPTPADSPFKPAWWYRTEFDLPAALRRPAPEAALRRHQLPRQHLAERHEDRGRHQRRRRLPPLRVRRDEARQAGRDERAGGGGLRPRAARPRHHVGGLEPHPRGQEHGAVGRRLPHRQRAPRPQEPARHPRPRPPVARGGEAHRHRRGARTPPTAPSPAW